MMIQERTTTTILLIVGMRDSGCRQRIAIALALAPGVLDVDVNLYRARAAVAHDPSCAAVDLVRVVVRLGYDAEIAGTDAAVGPQEQAISKASNERPGFKEPQHDQHDN